MVLERKERTTHLRALPAQCVIAPVPVSSSYVRTLDVTEVVIAQRCSPTTHDTSNVKKVQSLNTAPVIEAD